MTLHRCQVCGRRQPLTAAGTIRLHHRRGVICLGSKRLPYAEAADALREALRAAEAADKRHQAEWQRHKDLRLNAPLPMDFWKAWAAAAKEARRLRARLRRWSIRPLDRAAA